MAEMAVSVSVIWLKKMKFNTEADIWTSVFLYWLWRKHTDNMNTRDPDQ